MDVIASSTGSHLLVGIVFGLCSTPLAGFAAEGTDNLHIYGTPAGCLVQMSHPLKQSEQLRWDGSCVAEYASGEGTLSLLDPAGKVLAAARGVMQHGVQVGIWPDGALKPRDAGSEMASVRDGQHLALAGRSTDSANGMPPGLGPNNGFEAGSARLAPDVERKLMAFATELNGGELTKAGILVVGHTDASGKSDANQALSESRANAVRSFLVAKGVAPNRLTAVGRRDQQPLNSANRFAAENRRVTFAITGTP